ncbi:MAG: site-specific DNA-methyltransferase [Deltaproteobacteria bacterium]|nr:site-specific DNA-methyltransferase [Deltaproteobacteria bacterium]
MKTKHKIIFNNSKNIEIIPSDSIDLVVTSPPYPMIKMWDDMFCSQNSSIKNALKKFSGSKAFELMHQELDKVWDGVYRILKNGGFVCINIGDATRTLNGDFCLYSNHTRILHYLLKIGFKALPDILWRKQTNAPNKFMGSGMLPAGAYVTLEHEYILIVRKGTKREFKKADEKRNRRESAIFWEERNFLFSDIWMDVKGTKQELRDSKSRSRSAAYPFDIAYRLINMYSARGDTVLDPFLGTGTTMAAAMASARNSIGYEIDQSLKNTIYGIKSNIVSFSNQYIRNRIKKHIDFVAEKIQSKESLKYINKFYGFPVITNQEKELILNDLTEVSNLDKDTIEVSYSEEPQAQFCRDWETQFGMNLPTGFKHQKSIQKNRKI